MTTLTTRLKLLSWKQWALIVLLLLYLLYIALSYLYLPGKLKQVVETDVAQLVGRDITVERFDYNPFDLSLRIFNLNVPDKPDAPLVAWEQLYVNFTPWGSLFNWEVKLETLQLDQPEINIDKTAEGFNFSDIIERVAGGETQPEEGTAGPAIALEIVSTAINAGRFRFSDLSGKQPARSEMDDITIQVFDLYLATGDEHLNPFNITAAIPGGGTLKLAGEYRLDPLYVDTSVQAVGIELKEFSDFVNNVVPIHLSSGQLSLDAGVHLEQQGADLAFLFTGRDLSIAQLAMDDFMADPPMARIESLQVQGIEFDLLQQSVIVDRVQVINPLANQWMDEEGRLRFEHLLVEKVVDENVQQKVQQQAPQSGSPAAQEASEPWSVRVNRLQLDNGRFNFSHRHPDISRGHSVTQLNVTLQNLTLQEGERVPVVVSARLNEQGELTLEGDMALVPFNLQMDYSVKNLPLAPFSDYVQAATYLRIEKGALQVAGSVALDTAGDAPITSQLQVAVDNFQAEDTRTGKPVVQFKQVRLDEIALDTLAQKVSVGAVTLTEPNMLVAIDQDKQLNWASIAKDEGQTVAEAATEGKAAEPATGSTPWHYAVGKMEIKNGLTRFEDRSVTPAFTTGLHNVEFTLEELSSERNDPIGFALTSKIDRYAPFNIKGALDPIARQPGFTFKSQLSGLDMPALSPYSAEFIAYNLQSGKLNLNLDYQLHDNTLQGRNNIVAEQLYLGEKVENEDAIDAPVGLGLALLRDVNGVIDLDVGISGDIDDPGFSVSGVVLKALMNVLVKAATSPFTMLGALVGGSEDMGEIEFAPGRAELSADNQQGLQKLVQALQQRPQLIVRFHGAAHGDQDTPVLKKQRIQERVAAARKMSLPELLEEAGDVDWWTVRANRNAIEEINDALQLPAAAAREAALQAQNPQLKGDALDAAVYQAMYEAVADRQVITVTDLLALADQRALVVKQYLVDDLQLDHARVAVDKTRQEDLVGRVVNLELDAR